MRAREALKGRTVQMNDLNYYIGDSLARLERYRAGRAVPAEERSGSSRTTLRARAGLAMLYRAMGRDLDSERDDRGAAARVADAGRPRHGGAAVDDVRGAREGAAG